MSHTEAYTSEITGTALEARNNPSAAYLALLKKLQESRLAAGWDMTPPTPANDNESIIQQGAARMQSFNDSLAYLLGKKVDTSSLEAANDNPSDSESAVEQPEEERKAA